MLKVFEAFAGYGSQSLALKYENIPHEVVGISEIDKWAIKAYNALHDNVRNYGDIAKINPEDLPDFDLFTYSFPCQDISVAGYQKGINKNTRSGLLYECEKIIEVKRPKYLLLENVKQLVGKKFKQQFDEWLKYLESLGYTNYWKVLSATDYGVAQTRKRVFVISILNDTQGFSFPEPFPLKKTLKDYLENESDVTQEYYCNKPFEMVNKKNVVAEIPSYKYKAARRIHGLNSLAPTLTCGGGGQERPKILINGKVRLLTPKETFRLMGVKDEDIDKIQALGFSKSRQYILAGNSIVVDVLANIFKELFKEEQ